MSSEIPLELDFFKYAQGSHVKRKTGESSSAPEGKRRKVDVDEEDEDEDMPAQREATKSTTVHRVSTKGSDIPSHIDSFEDLKNIASVPSHLFTNLKSSGYTEPTSIQAYGIPILLKVGPSTSMAASYLPYTRIAT